jgi:hypothetical protein
MEIEGIQKGECFWDETAIELTFVLVKWSCGGDEVM